MQRQPVLVALCAGLLTVLPAENGANYLRIWTCCKDWAMAVEARKSAWGRSWAWDPPIVADPTRPLKASPSHAVALLPETGYVLSRYGAILVVHDKQRLTFRPKSGDVPAEKDRP